MNLDEAKTKIMLDDLHIDRDRFGRIFAFVDFGNVNYWYEKDRRDDAGQALATDEKLIVNIARLGEFVGRIAERGLFYYGMDDSRPTSLHLIKKARESFKTVVTKPIQKVHHYLETDEPTSRVIRVDGDGKKFIIIPKCNFDVELCLDAVRLASSYDTMCIFTGDNDFKVLLEYLRRQGKRIILVHGSNTRGELKDKADLMINAQLVKRYIAEKKHTKRPDAPYGGRGLDIGPVSTGRAPVAGNE